MADNNLSKYDQDFAHATEFKLWISREKKRKASEVSKPVNEPSETKEEVIFDGSATIAKAMRRDPSLTKREAEEIIYAFNYDVFFKTSTQIETHFFKQYSVGTSYEQYLRATTGTSPGKGQNR